MHTQNNISILYEDNHLLVVEKPVNVPVQTDISKDLDLLSMLKLYIKEKYNKPGNVYLGLVHRLDRPVGGVMVFAKTSKAASRLSEHIRKGEMQRNYLAVTEGTFKSSSGSYHNYLLKDRDKNKVSVVSKDTINSREAILEYKVVVEHESKTLLKINLITGRSHQIRVQLSYNGHPIVGDAKYGKAARKSATDNLALWAYQLSVKHPVKDEIMSFTSQPPDCFPWNLFKAFEI